MMTTTQATDNNFIDAPPPMITDTILPPPLPAPITATNTTFITPTNSVATSDYLTPAISNTNAAPSTSDSDSLLPVLIAIAHSPHLRPGRSLANPSRRF
ncbi:unnamed protein product [Schistocephalus solidus]|uniref:Uncharacterized protein n=1 Tax=Schistocephalus solidus TaxID=70667 RepID=A0A183SEY0_SCHSO|nr:unnamed protein product [Schistocephalus solidus]